jgi:hypothetical protein
VNAIGGNNYMSVLAEASLTPAATGVPGEATGTNNI